MNDRFKFRVWFNKLKRYSKNTDDLVLTEDGMLCAFNTVGCYSKEDVIIEQCTGLKDKSGRLIFEGDIVKDEEGFIGLVKYDEVCAMFKIEFVYSEPSNFEDDMSWEFEVIGNIHENPELAGEE